MILRRIIDHFRKQEWTAIAIDFAIVVVGVLMAFQITAWNEERSERARSQEYLSRIRADVEGDIGELQRRKDFWALVTIEGYAAVRYAETGDTGGATEWKILRSFLHASQAWTFRFNDTTYAELRSAGELGLIPDADLRSALADYYVAVVSRRGGSGHYSLMPAYREIVRGRTRSDIMRYYWRECFKQSTGMQEFIDCPPPPGISDVKQVLDEMASDRAIIDALRYWVDTVAVATELADFDLGRAAKLIDLVDELK